jgi:hypothetical protein
MLNVERVSARGQVVKWRRKQRNRGRVEGSGRECGCGCGGVPLALD